MSRNPFETALKNEQRAIELRKLNEALNRRSHGDTHTEPAAAVKLAETILRAQSSE